MALSEQTLTTGQDTVMDPLIANYQMMKQRLDAAQALHDKAVLALEEYSKQAAEKLGIDVQKDYTFDIGSKKFIDRSTLTTASAEASQPAKP